LGFSKIAFSTTAPNLVVAAAAAAAEGVVEGLENPVGVNRGIYYSIDCGETWTFTNIEDSGTIIGPSSVTSVSYNAGTHTFYAAVRYHGFYFSTDGVTWMRMPNQPGAGLTAPVCPPQTASPSSCPIYRGEIAVVPGRPEMYVWYVDANDIDQGIWETTDGGNTWLQLDETGIINCGDVFGGCGTSQGTYNLTLAAVPNCVPSDPNCGVTDIYAGAVNIYKCEISPEFPTCNPNVNPPPPPDATFLNLTHVYGCPPNIASIAHVHPAQHAMAFLLNNNHQDVMYFANDGGIYRALDGFSDLLTGTCGGTNEFESLNQTIGSMTQLVAFSQNSGNPNTLLAGSQGNGSPATGTAEGATTWQSVNTADGGYNIINPLVTDEWFTENTGVSIQKCEFGISCTADDFNNGLIVSNTTLGGDVGPLYTPYILDPNNSAELVVGTCRVWRGTTDGTGFIAVSDSFDTGAPGACTGAEVNQVRSIANGGALQSGLSNVVYAGTDGLGPNGNQPATGGRILVTTNALLGPNSWSNLTNGINPDFYPISSITIDPSDPTGFTAYATIMGFNASHVWKTTSAGSAWTDFTGNLPDAPANIIIVDDSSSTIYVGTDVGVFSASTSGPPWTEVGPLSGIPQAGFIPNVPVTRLAIFNSNGEKLLRASTYGRGMWEYPILQPPFEIIVGQPNPLTVFAETPGLFNLTINPISGYSATVMLNCDGGSLTCTPNPASLSFVPPDNPQNFTVSATGSTGSYSLNVTGTDQSRGFTSPPATLTLQVVSFSLSPPSPSSVSLGTPAMSVPISIQVSASGPFNDPVTLSCAPPLPAGISCAFEPQEVNPMSGTNAASILHVTTSANTPSGSYTLKIEAAVNPPISGEPDVSQMLQVDVTQGATVTFTLQDETSVQSIPVGQSAMYTLLFTPINGVLPDDTTFACKSETLPTSASCTFNPAKINAGSGMMELALTVSSSLITPAGTYTIDLVGTSGSLTANATAELTLKPGSQGGAPFSINNNTGAQTVAASQTATYLLAISTGSGFSNPVAFSCGSLPPATSCLFSPAQIAPGTVAEPNITTLSITTTAQVLAYEPRSESIWTTGLGLMIVGILLGAVPPSKRQSKLRSTGIVVALCLLTALIPSCGGGTGVANGQSGTPAGTYVINVSGTSGANSESAVPAITLVVQ
jgi:hypothetical protein